MESGRTKEKGKSGREAPLKRVAGSRRGQGVQKNRGLHANIEKPPE